jgi:hypothetical protein
MSLAHNRYNAFGADASNRSFYGQTEDGARLRCSRSASAIRVCFPSSRCMDYIRNPASDPARTRRNSAGLRVPVARQWEPQLGNRCSSSYLSSGHRRTTSFA